MPAPVHAFRDQRRSFSAIFSSVAISTTGFLASNTVNGLVAEDLTASAAWSGVPGAATVLGTAAGASWLAWTVRQVGPRHGLALGYLIAALAIALAGYAVVAHHFIAFVAALFLFGVGFGANRLARYAAADLYPPARRATMIGWIVWASTIGSVAGPALLAPSQAVGQALGLGGMTGPYLVCLAGCLIAAAMMWAAPRSLDARPSAPARDSDRALSVVLRHPDARLALVSMVSGQFVMVLLMTMTPLHLRHAGHGAGGLGPIGLVIAAHTLGMYAFSPITGWLADRLGRVRLLAVAMAILVLSAIVGLAAGDTSYSLMIVSLFLLGLGWNVGFVSGSALLTDSVPAEHRVRVQGAGDTLVWSGSALASIGSGWLLASVGFSALNLVAAVLAMAPIALFRARRPRPQ